MSPPSSQQSLGEFCCCCWQYMYATCYINHLVSWHQITIKCVIAGEIKHNIAQLNTETAGISHFWNFLKWCASPTPAAPSLPICLPLPTPGSGSQVEIYQAHTRTALQYSYHFNDGHCWEGKIATGRGRTSLVGGYPAVQSAAKFECTDVKIIFMGTITAWNSKPGTLGGIVLSSFTFKGIKDWNRLQSDVRTTINYNTFRKHLRTATAG